MYFDTNATIDEHPAAKDILFTVIAGHGFVKIGGETQPIAAGQAILWPANLPHQAWTEDSEMTAIIVDPLP